MRNISFRPLDKDDLPLLHRWLNEPHMRTFYQKTPLTIESVIEKYTPRIERKVPAHSHIVLADGTAIGKIQCYRAVDYPDFAGEIGVEDGISVDLFIGEPAFLGQGLGKAMLGAYLHLVAFVLFPEETRCYICHEKSNIPALSCSKSAGFEYVRDVVESGERSELLVYKKA